MKGFCITIFVLLSLEQVFAVVSIATAAFANGGSLPAEYTSTLESDQKTLKNPGKLIPFTLAGAEQASSSVVSYYHIFCYQNESTDSLWGLKNINVTSDNLTVE